MLKNYKVLESFIMNCGGEKEKDIIFYLINLFDDSSSSLVHRKTDSENKR